MAPGAVAPAALGVLAWQRLQRLCPTTLSIGTAGFEPATPCSQSRCATKLRYVPYERGYQRPAMAQPPGRYPAVTDRWAPATSRSAPST